MLVISRQQTRNKNFIDNNMDANSQLKSHAQFSQVETPQQFIDWVEAEFCSIRSNQEAVRKMNMFQTPKTIATFFAQVPMIKENRENHLLLTAVGDFFLGIVPNPARDAGGCYRGQKLFISEDPPTRLIVTSSAKPLAELYVNLLLPVVVSKLRSRNTENVGEDVAKQIDKMAQVILRSLSRFTHQQMPIVESMHAVVGENNDLSSTVCSHLISILREGSQCYQDSELLHVALTAVGNLIHRASGRIPGVVRIPDQFATTEVVLLFCHIIRNCDSSNNNQNNNNNSPVGDLLQICYNRALKILNFVTSVPGELLPLAVRTLAPGNAFPVPSTNFQKLLGRAVTPKEIEIVFKGSSRGVSVLFNRHLSEPESLASYTSIQLAFHKLDCPATDDGVSVLPPVTQSMRHEQGELSCTFHFQNELEDLIILGEFARNRHDLVAVTQTLLTLVDFYDSGVFNVCPPTTAGAAQLILQMVDEEIIVPFANRITLSPESLEFGSQLWELIGAVAKSEMKSGGARSVTNSGFFATPEALRILAKTQHSLLQHKQNAVVKMLIELNPDALRQFIKHGFWREDYEKKKDPENNTSTCVVA